MFLAAFLQVAGTPSPVQAQRSGSTQEDWLTPDWYSPESFSYDLWNLEHPMGSTFDLPHYLQEPERVKSPVETRDSLEKSADRRLFLRGNRVDRRVQDVLDQVRHGRQEREENLSPGNRFLKDLREQQVPLREFSEWGQEESLEEAPVEPGLHDWRDRLQTRQTETLEEPGSSKEDPASGVDGFDSDSFADIPGMRAPEGPQLDSGTVGPVEGEEAPRVEGNPSGLEVRTKIQESEDRYRQGSLRRERSVSTEVGDHTEIQNSPSERLKEEEAAPVPYDSPVRQRLRADLERARESRGIGSGLSSQQLRSQSLGGTASGGSGALAPYGTLEKDPAGIPPRTGPQYHRNTSGDVRQPDYSYRYEGFRRYSIGEREYGNQPIYQGQPYYRR
jgi:hypothetical protein